MAHSQVPTPTRTPSTGTGSISRSSSLSSHQSLSHTASLSSVPTPPTWLQSHSNSRAAYAQARGFDLVNQIHASLQKQVDSRGLAAAASRSATPAQSSPEESPEARAERLDREDLAAVNAEVDQYFSEPCKDKRTDPLVYWQARSTPGVSSMCLTSFLQQLDGRKVHDNVPSCGRCSSHSCVLGSI
ncbi:hypothetical protein OH76DRAFT_1091360 [Lentinus brumalis]|uniref:Uncharacterized protein n=1 Tax=Lentinus brumalis TaxID=2498619 RepID=A0A371CTP6_9APHY|nr:hypothetical protein OH76DRAFT_1187493 [Polyporus brumalis]RDX44574.1 hypothetical protein OH76DRAFT_1091360 [Polyporus brumalis]